MSEMSCLDYTIYLGLCSIYFMQDYFCQGMCYTKRVSIEMLKNVRSIWDILDILDI